MNGGIMGFTFTRLFKIESKEGRWMGGGSTVHSHDSSSPETSNKTSLLSAPPWREGSQLSLFPSSSSELPSQTQSLLETSF